METFESVKDSKFDTMERDQLRKVQSRLVVGTTQQDYSWTSHQNGSPPSYDNMDTISDPPQT